MTNNNEIISLQSRLKEARESYYNLDPQMSDSEYDALKEQLEKLDPTNHEVTTVGASVPKTSVWQKVQHEIPMGSLNKVNSEEEFIEWTNKYGSNEEYFMTHKLDGSSLELVYEDGILIRGVTRGDGSIGEDISLNVFQIPSIPKKLNKHIPGKVFVRGEVVMHKDVFKNLYESKYANPRNTAAGKVRDKKGGGIDCQNLHFYGFELVLGTQRPKTEEIQFQALKALGFLIPWNSAGSVSQLISEFKIQVSNRDSLPYEIDGEVVSINNVAKQDELGEHNMRPYGKVAWKFAAQGGVTKIIDVIFQVGPTGRITPVACVEPVKIGGVSIERISLHNLKMFRELNLHKGDEVLVVRKGDVISYVSENLTYPL